MTKDIRRYEVLMLTVPEITKDETTELEKGIDKIVRAQKGAVISFDRWGKYTLSYPVRKKNYGVYFLARLELTNESDKALLNELRSFFAIKASDIVMRNMIARLDAQAPLLYQRPRSLEEAPTSRDVDSFLKENKMSGLSSGSSLDVSKKADADTDDQAMAIDNTLPVTEENDIKALS